MHQQNDNELTNGWRNDRMAGKDDGRVLTIASCERASSSRCRSTSNAHDSRVDVLRVQPALVAEFERSCIHLAFQVQPDRPQQILAALPTPPIVPATVTRQNIRRPRHQTASHT